MYRPSNKRQPVELLAALPHDAGITTKIEGAMPDKERRKAAPPPSRALERLLNSAQIDALRSLEHFGWELKFVRKPLFQPAVPIVFDGDRKSYAVIEEDGSVNANPPFKIRP
jgi:hypothetical protein